MLERFEHAHVGDICSTCTIIIVTYNGWVRARECLAALEAERQTGVDVLMVDNGSSDGTPELVRREFGWVNVVENRRNLGFAAATIWVSGNPRANSCCCSIATRSSARSRWPHDTRQSHQHRRIGSVAATMVFHSRPEVVASAGIEVFSNGLALDRALGKSLASVSDRTPIFGASAGAAITAARRS